MKHITEKIILITMALFHLFISSAFAEAEDRDGRDVYPDHIEEEVASLRNLNSVDERRAAADKFKNSLRDGRIAQNHPQVIQALENALFDTDREVIHNVLVALKYTNAPSAKNAVKKFLTHDDLPSHIRLVAKDTLNQIENNQRSFEQFVKDFEDWGFNREFTVAYDMTRFFDREKYSPYFRTILNGKAEFKNDFDKKDSVMRAIAWSRDETLQRLFLNDFFEHAITDDNFGEGSVVISYLGYFDHDLIYLPLLSILQNPGVDETRKREAMDILFDKLPLELLDETVQKVRDGVKDDEFSDSLIRHLDRLTKQWKIKHNIDETPTEESQENNENTNEDAANENPMVAKERMTREAILTCIGGVIGGSHFTKMAENISEIKQRIDSETVQKPNDTSTMHSKTKEIERQLRNAIERFEMDTQSYEITIEPMEKEILRLHNEINGPFPGTLKRAVTDVLEVFGYNDFGTHESHRREIEKKRFEIREKKREMVNPAMEELKIAYREGVRFFNSYFSEKKVFPVDLKEGEWLSKSQEMLSEFSKLQR